MITFLISLVALFLGYVLYSRVAERIFGPDDRETPAIRRADKIDYTGPCTDYALGMFQNQTDFSAIYC